MDKNKHWFNFIKLAVIVLTMLFVFLTANDILLLKSKDGIEQFRSFYRQGRDTVDVLFTGNSHSYCHINPGILWEDYGISSYDLGGAEQPFSITYYYIKEALKTQHPEVICLDISAVGRTSAEYLKGQWLITNLFGMKINTNRWRALGSSISKNAVKDYIFPLASTHGRYKELESTDFDDRFDNINYKGFLIKEGIQSFEKPEAAVSTEKRAPIRDHEDEYLRMIIEYVQSEDIPLIFMASPYVITEEEQARFNTVFDIAESYGVPCIDFNKLYDELQLDFDTDFAEEAHLNRVGSAKLTRYIGDELTTRYSLTDHRNDPAYSSWDASAEYLRQDYAAFYMKTITDAGTLFDLFFNGTGDNDPLIRYFTGNPRDYVLFMQIYDDPSIMSKEVSEKLSSIGIEDPIPGGKYIINDKEIVFMTGDPEFRTSYSTPSEDILFMTEDNEDHETIVKIQSESYTIPRIGTAILVYDTSLEKFVTGFRIDPVTGQLTGL